MANKKKSRRSQQKSNRAVSRPLEDCLHQIDRLMFGGKLAQARELLEDLDRRYPQQQELLLRLTNVHHDLKDYPEYQAACERLVAVRPSAGFTLMLAGSYLANLMPILALRTFRRFLERWPDHPRAGEARETVTTLESGLVEVLAGAKLTGPDALEVAELHERVQSLLARGRFPEARQKAEELLRRRPNFTAALNNMGEAYFREGDLIQAIASARRTLEIDQENVHALSNLTRYSCLSGRLEDARAYAERLKSAPPQGHDVWTKKAEALSCLGDDQAVLDVFHAYQQSAAERRTPEPALLFHLAAVAAFRLGHEEEGKHHWNKALKLQPGSVPARENVDDLRKLVGQRHMPWPFPFNHWVSARLLNDLIAFYGQKQADSQVKAEFHGTHPELLTLVPILLDRGDPAGREFALRAALSFKTPEMLAALQHFALSQRGPDGMRSEAAQAAAKAGLLPSGPVRLWIQGEWRETLLFGWEITTEPLNAYKHSSQVQSLLAEAFEAMHRGHASRAASLHRQALELEPDSPDILNNLGASYQAQGRQSEAEALLRQVHERFPDYLFGRTGMAKLCIQEGRLADAKALLDPLMTRKRFHVTEFAALAAAQIDYWLAQKKKEGARSWIEMWEKVDPNSKLLPIYRRKLRPLRWLGPLPAWLR